jgi:hypothetical protein
MNLMQALSLPQISKAARRTALTAVAVGIVALAALVLTGYGLAGVGVCIGLGLALANFRFTGVAAAKAVRAERASNRRPLALNTLGRLGLVTIIAVGLLLLDAQLGFGVLIGLAVFQFILLSNMTVSMLRDGGLGAGLAKLDSGMSGDLGSDGNAADGNVGDGKFGRDA